VCYKDTECVCEAGLTSKVPRVVAGTRKADTDKTAANIQCKEGADMNKCALEGQCYKLNSTDVESKVMGHEWTLTSADSKLCKAISAACRGSDGLADAATLAKTNKDKVRTSTTD